MCEAEAEAAARFTALGVYYGSVQSDACRPEKKPDLDHGTPGGRIDARLRTKRSEVRRSVNADQSRANFDFFLPTDSPFLTLQPHFTFSLPHWHVMKYVM